MPALLSLFISDKDKNLNWRCIPSKVFSLCALQCDMQIGGRGGLLFTYKQKKKKRNAGNYHKTNNERLCRKVFEEQS